MSHALATLLLGLPGGRSLLHACSLQLCEVCLVLECLFEAPREGSRMIAILSCRLGMHTLVCKG